MLKGAGEACSIQENARRACGWDVSAHAGSGGLRTPQSRLRIPTQDTMRVEEGVVDGRFLPAAVGTEGLTRESGATAGYLRPTAPSLRAWRKACQPGMPFTPPPACVAQEPWYRPRIGVR